MEAGRVGLHAGAGFMDYEGMYLKAYCKDRITVLIAMLRHFEEGSRRRH